MGRKNFVFETLESTGTVTWKPHGNSMTPKISSGDEVCVKKVDKYFQDDIVYAKVKGTYYLHLLSAVNESQDRYQISNNHGHVNGWVKRDAVYGVCVRVLEKILLTDAQVAARINGSESE